MNFQALVAKEREAQDKKWGQRDHNTLGWLVILVEEVGEFAKVILESPDPIDAGYELIQIAAVCQAAWESIDRYRGQF